MFQRDEFKLCRYCQRSVNSNDKNCPYCGSPVKKDVLPKILIGALLLVLLSTLAIPTESKIEKERKKIVNATAATIDMRDWSKDLNNQAQLNKIEEIEGKIVELQLKVFVATYMSDYFGVVTMPSDGIPGTYLMLYPSNKAESDFLKNIKAGQRIKIRGKIKGTFLRRIKIEPAYLI